MQTGLAVLYARGDLGIDAPLITVEVHLAHGLPAFNIVGLPEATIREARDRVRSAITNGWYEFPAKKITVNLAPADLPKVGARFDLAIAIGILTASGQLPKDSPNGYEFAGELALSGHIRPIRGILPFANACAQQGRSLFLPHGNLAEARLVKQARLLPADHLKQVVKHLNGDELISVSSQANRTLTQAHSLPPTASEAKRDMQDIIGQAGPKRALEIAAAGGHHLLLCGPPGTGKTMLAQRLPDLLPPLTESEALETASLYSISPHAQTHWLQRPFRNPHHSASATALIGGGSFPRPGEVSLSHNGVLFLDELTEFSRRTLDNLRQPLESGEICISRAAMQLTFPARFQLVAAMNPSPSGTIGDGRCSDEQILRYLKPISGPLLDRFDLQVDVCPLPQGFIAQASTQKGDASSKVKQRVAQARDVQLSRGECLNNQLGAGQLEAVCSLSTEQQRFLQQAVSALGLSMRGYHKVLKVARTIADLEQCPQIQQAHLAEALNYRVLERLLSRLS